MRLLDQRTRRPMPARFTYVGITRNSGRRPGRVHRRQRQLRRARDARRRRRDAAGADGGCESEGHRQALRSLAGTRAPRGRQRGRAIVDEQASERPNRTGLARRSSCAGDSRWCCGPARPGSPEQETRGCGPINTSAKAAELYPLVRPCQLDAREACSPTSRPGLAVDVAHGRPGCRPGSGCACRCPSDWHPPSARAASRRRR